MIKKGGITNMKGVFGKYVDVNLSNLEIKDYLIPEE